ncbi:hypothetical protein [uncultured Fusobacterium sp.]|uniref:hypothetical protein n=1 Tax=uncultured Fusobacterium sp. TaxID=159267 RepID=UPI0025FC33BC|nr:hypothetical protein [uncultured Fusobacterium sp.]
MKFDPSKKKTENEVVKASMLKMEQPEKHKIEKTKKDYSQYTKVGFFMKNEDYEIVNLLCKSKKMTYEALFMELLKSNTEFNTLKEILKKV